MSSYKSFKNYSFSNSLKSFTDPFQQLLKRPATSTPSALFTPTNYTEPQSAPPTIPTIPKVTTSIKPPVSATTSPTKPIVPQVATTTIPTAPPVATGTTQGTSQDTPGASPTPATPQVSPEVQKALDLAKGDWILQLDADERVTGELAREIKEVISMNNNEIKINKKT